VREDRRTTESIMWREILQWANKWSITAESHQRKQQRWTKWERIKVRAQCTVRAQWEGTVRALRANKVRAQWEHSERDSGELIVRENTVRTQWEHSVSTWWEEWQWELTLEGNSESTRSTLRAHWEHRRAHWELTVELILAMSSLAGTSFLIHDFGYYREFTSPLTPTWVWVNAVRVKFSQSPQPHLGRGSHRDFVPDSHLKESQSAHAPKWRFERKTTSDKASWKSSHHQVTPPQWMRWTWLTWQSQVKVKVLLASGTHSNWEHTENTLRAHREHSDRTVRARWESTVRGSTKHSEHTVRRHSKSTVRRAVRAQWSYLGEESSRAQWQQSKSTMRGGARL
jgi:hypothetical protein